MRKHHILVLGDSMDCPNQQIAKVLKELGMNDALIAYMTKRSTKQ